jgi:hypothetical protein
VSSEFVSSIAMSLRAGLGGSTSSGVAGAVAQGYPANATQNEIKIWDNTQKAFANEEVRSACAVLCETTHRCFHCHFEDLFYQQYDY